MIHQFYLLRPFTNLHVGSGDTNFGVIDKLIERDPTTGFPCINSSGLRGAIKQHLAPLVPNDKIKRIFGSTADVNKGSKASDKDTGQGECFFLSAQLLALPVRTDKTPFVLATSPALLSGLMQNYQDVTSLKHSCQIAVAKLIELLFNKNLVYEINNKFVGADFGATGLKISQSPTQWLLDTEIKQIAALFNNSSHPICIIPDEHMVDLCNDLNLPVIARNSLDDGDSKNLWYEQILPRESLLYFSVNWIKELRDIAESEIIKNAIQIGGNASVGYGFTRIYKQI